MLSAGAVGIGAKPVTAAAATTASPTPTPRPTETPHASPTPRPTPSPTPTPKPVSASFRYAVTYQDGHSQLFTGTGAVVQHVENGLHIVLSGYSSDHAEFERLGIFVGNVLPGATTFGLTNNVYPLVALQANGYGDGSYFENIDPYLPLNVGSLAVSVSTEKVSGALNSYLGLNVLRQQKRFVAIKGEFIALPAKP